MTSIAIEALYIFDQYNESILEHTYRSRPASARAVLPLYLAQPIPRQSLTYLPDIKPPTVLFSLQHSNLLLLSPTSADTEPLVVLEFLHRIVDVLEDLLGAPLLASKIEGAYDVVAQVLAEMCDAGSICNTEANSLRDSVDIPGWMGKLLGGVGLPGSSPALLPSGGLLKQQPSLSLSTNGPAIPWRRANVRHTSNELYVDIVETLSVTLAPSGRPLAAFANGSIAFTSKISGIPDLRLTLSAPGGKMSIDRTLELPVFHPCVRLARWKEKPGELSFVPPDGKFVLAGYEVNLLPEFPDLKSWATTKLQLPVSIEVSKSLGWTGADFEVRLILSSNIPGISNSASRSGFGSRGSGRSTPGFGGNSTSSPALQDLTVTIPIPRSVRNITDLRASRGEAYFLPSDDVVEWRIPTKDASSAGNATLRCTVVGAFSDNEEEITNGLNTDAIISGYDEREETYQLASETVAVPVQETKQRQEERNLRKVQQYEPLMPSSASVGFSIKGWLASGIKVEGLVIDIRKSRGLAENVKPYKGVKYLTVSKKGIETRC